MIWGLTGDISFIDTWRNHEIQTNDLFGISRFGDSILEDIPFCKREYETYISLYHNTAPSNLLDEHPSENGTWDENHSSRHPYISQTVSTKHSHISQTYDSKNGTLNLMEENVGSKHILIVTSIALVLFMTIAIFVRYWFLGKRRRKLLHSPVCLR
ncbi:uncharacterized protein LOC128547244 [Mercenaria mercenaria]|uniref:uncharacterized protein LOC128547244 n=1 Tax=Mercenaria mercenaria TaxID=6596 RepID=UPI00234F20A9|nr:uncharacterized protein LOC128547244 [Mercenaria mercenaria]